ncbi:MAG TPA: hypothetical protein VE992_03500 [Solirubrobacteraceae bacterium]|nr:hypothetical protein [Solirubrobacteraceae bacterium]
MTGQLIMLPVRLWLRGARLAVHTAEDVAGVALTATLRAAGTLTNLRPGARDTPTAPPPPAPPAPPTEQPASTRAPRPQAPPEEERTPERPSTPRSNGADAALASERLEREGATVAIDLDAPPRREPAHVSAEPTLVREEAEPGAADGAGAAIRIQEPWDGYARMNAREVIARLSGSSTAELAAIQLYESAHRNRQTVLQAAARALKMAGGPR